MLKTRSTVTFSQPITKPASQRRLKPAPRRRLLPPEAHPACHRCTRRSPAPNLSLSTGDPDGGSAGIRTQGGYEPHRLSRSAPSAARTRYLRGRGYTADGRRPNPRQMRGRSRRSTALLTGITMPHHGPDNRAQHGDGPHAQHGPPSARRRCTSPHHRRSTKKRRSSASDSRSRTPATTSTR